MNKLPGLSLLFLLISCTHPSKPANNGPHAKDKAAQLEAFLDSIGHLPQQALMDKADREPDSIFRSQTQLDTLISPKDFETLKRAAHKGVMRVSTARRIFKNKNISYDCTTKDIFVTYRKGLIPVVYTAFSKDTNSFDEYALYIGDPGQCQSAALYFFKGKRIIAQHDGYNRFADTLAWYKDVDGKTVVHYGKDFVFGSGIAWNNYYFYKYEGNKLIPILDELETGDLMPPAPRAIWLESTIQSTRPLTIKMVYYQYFSGDASFPDSTPNLINDSTVVTYQWDEQTKTLKGNYAQSKLSRAQIMSYNLGDNDYLFLNAYYPLLKRALKDKKQRNWVLWYLEQVKNDKMI
jgi:hypothetical protein